MSISRFIFISAARASRSAEANAVTHASLGADLRSRGIEACEVDGYYEGAHEKSWMINVDVSIESGNSRAGVESAAVRLGRRYRQDSILVVDSLGEASLVYVYLGNGGREYMGAFFQTTQPVDQLQGYSVLPDGSVWTCQKEASR
jgi:hypothetical protein